MTRPRFRDLRRVMLPAMVLGAVVAAGCGAASGRGGDVTAGGAPEVSAAGLPEGLAKNIRQANVMIDGPGDLLARKLRTLRGSPVVVNQWASWCGPCKTEFPFFATSARRHRADIAFVGLDARDDKDAGVEFLEEFPVIYPSIFDPDGEYSADLGGGRSFPTTMFLDETGDVVQVREGGYASLDQLERDIGAFLLDGESES